MALSQMAPLLRPYYDTELLFEYFSDCSFSGFSCPFSLFYFHCRRWRADWPSRLSINRDELIDLIELITLAD